MSRLILKEGMTLSEAVVEAEKVLNIKKVHFLMSPDRSVCEGVKVGGVKIWFPKNLRTSRGQLQNQILAAMKLKEMIMYNNEKAFFLVTNDPQIKK